MSTQCICEHPRVICHPKLPELIAKYKHYVFKGEEIRKPYPRHPSKFNWSAFSVKRNHITADEVDKCYVIDDSTGECFPMYLLVPCGHCDLCKVSKQNAFVERCRLETEVYNFKPWFATLTYNNDSVPADGVSVRDCQLFLKRFRVNLKRAGYNFLIRYVLVAEYGTHTHRPHYHAIFWNINSMTTEQYFNIVDILHKSWNNGFVYCRLVDPSDDKSFYYTSKYLRKDCEVPAGCNKTFMLSSRRNGGIGAPFVDGIKDEMHKTLNTSFKFLSKWSNSVCTIKYTRYIIERLFPSFCKSVSSVFRNSVVGMIECATHIFRKYSVDLEIDSLKNLISKYIYLPQIDCKLPDEHCLSRFPMVKQAFDGYKQVFQKQLERIKKYGFTLEDFLERALKLQELRTLFLSRLFEFRHPIDVKLRKYQCQKILSYNSPLTLHV